MKRVVVCVLNFFFAGATVLSAKKICETATVSDRYLREQSITEPSQTSHSLFKQVIPEPLAACYGTKGLPIRRVDGNIQGKIRCICNRIRVRGKRLIAGNS